MSSSTFLGRLRSPAPWVLLGSTALAAAALQASPSPAPQQPTPGRAAPKPLRPDDGSVHGPSPSSPRIVTDDDYVHVDTPDGPIRIRRTSPCSAVVPYPACLLCHCYIEDATQNMGGLNLDCTFCHGGDPLATTQADAHVHPNGQVTYDQTVPPLDQDLEYQRFVNPSNLRVVEQTCAMCHGAIALGIPKSMMATASGHYAGGLYQNDVQQKKTPIYGTFAVSDDDGEVPYERGAVDSLIDLLTYDPSGDPSLLSTHFAAVPSQACARCHLWSRGKGYRGAANADGVYRADGCAACHMLYDDDGLSRSCDASIDHTEKGHPRHHVVTREIPSQQCIHCHHRGARIGLSFTGRAQMPPRLPSGPGVPGTTDVRFNGNFHYTVPKANPQDAHHAAGLQSIDCHVAEEIMGDGNIWGHMDQATKIDCRTCHGLPDRFPTLHYSDSKPMPNVRADGDAVILTSKVTGAEHQVPIVVDFLDPDSANYNATAAHSMDDRHLRPEGGLECYACHAAWVPNCFGCHFERDERLLGLNLMTRRQEVGKVTTNNKVFETVRHFSLGPNSAGRVAPYLVGCQPIADVTAPDGSKILDFVMPDTTNGLSGLAHNPVHPHTVRGPGEVRTCAECHRSPPTLGLGSGHYALARDHVYTAGISGVALYDRKADPSQPAPAGTLPFLGAARGLAVLPNVVHGTTDFLYVALGSAGVAIYDRRPGGPPDPVGTIAGVDAIDVARVARYLYVVDAGVGVRIYDNDMPGVATLVATVPLPTAVRVVPWGIHLFVAAGRTGLVVVDVADHHAPVVAGMLPGVNAVDVQPYAHQQEGPSFAARAYVADPDYGVRIVDLLPDHGSPKLVGGLPLPGASGLDAYTRYVLASATEPSREHDYLYVAAGPGGLHVFDMTDPDDVVEVAALTSLGGVVADVDVTSHMAPPGTDDYAILANAPLGLQVVGVDDPAAPVLVGTVAGSVPATRVLVEVQQMDRFIDEQGRPLKENSHPFTQVFSRADIVRILSAPID